MPTVSEPKMVPPRRNAASFGSLLEPKDGARPPSAGGVGGAIGESPQRDRPTRAGVFGGRAVVGGGRRGGGLLGLRRSCRDQRERTER